MFYICIYDKTCFQTTSWSNEALDSIMKIVAVKFSRCTRTITVTDLSLVSDRAILSNMSYRKPQRLTDVYCNHVAIHYRIRIRKSRPQYLKKIILLIYYHKPMRKMLTKESIVLLRELFKQISVIQNHTFLCLHTLIKKRLNSYKDSRY